MAVNWGENNFWDNMPVNSTVTLQFKKFVEIALACSVSEINVFFCFTQNSKMAAKSGRKTIFG